MGQIGDRRNELLANGDCEAWMEAIRRDDASGLNAWLALHPGPLTGFVAWPDLEDGHPSWLRMLNFAVASKSRECVRLLARLSAQRDELESMARIHEAICARHSDDPASGDGLLESLGIGLAEGQPSPGQLSASLSDPMHPHAGRRLWSAYCSASRSTNQHRGAAAPATAPELAEQAEREAYGAIAADDPAGLAEAIDAFRVAIPAQQGALGKRPEVAELSWRLFELAAACRQPRCLPAALGMALIERETLPDLKSTLLEIHEAIGLTLGWERESAEGFRASLSEAVRVAALLIAKKEEDIEPLLDDLCVLDWEADAKAGLLAALADIQAVEIGAALPTPTGQIRAGRL